MFMLGHRVLSNPLCVKVEVTWSVERHATQKRRRNWRVVRHQRDVPCAYKLADDTLMMHPDLFKQVAAQAKGGAA